MNSLNRLFHNEYFNLIINYIIAKTLADLASPSPDILHTAVMLLTMLIFFWLDRKLGVVRNADS